MRSPEVNAGGASAWPVAGSTIGPYQLEVTEGTGRMVDSRGDPHASRYVAR